MRHRFQNFFIAKDLSYDNATYGFLPFAFSGITINRSGDGVEANLVLPNNDLSRNWAVDAMTLYDANGLKEDPWLAHVLVVALDVDSEAVDYVLYEHWGQFSGGSWDETSLELNLSTVLDAVGGDVPMRRLTQDLVGHLPVQSGLRLQ
mgnify:CR=1 FL=1